MTQLKVLIQDDDHGLDSLAGQQLPEELAAAVSLSNLVVDSFFNLPSRLIPGDSVSVSWKALNTGDAATPASPFDDPAWVDSIYFSTDTELDPSDILLGSKPFFGSPAYSGNPLPGIGDPNNFYFNYIFAFDHFRIPTNLSGSGYILLKLDSGNSIAESNEDDNVLASAAISIGPAAINLTPTNLEFTTQNLAWGRDYSFNYTLENLGPDDTTTQWVDSLYFSTDAIFDAGDRSLALWTIGSPEGQPVLAAGQSNTFYLESRLPDNEPTQNGYFFLKTNPDADQIETNYTDNISAPIPVHIEAADVNLRVSNTANYQQLVLDGSQPVTLSFNTLNTGTETTADWVKPDDAVYWSTDDKFDNGPTEYDYRLADRSNDATGNFPLAPGSSYDTTLTFDLPSWLVGSTGYLLLVSDPYGWLVETSEQDNSIAIPTGIYDPNDLPDLSISFDGEPPAEALLSSQPLQLSWTVTNTAGTAAAPSWYDQLWFSPDAIFDDADPNDDNNDIPGPSFRIDASTIDFWPLYNGWSYTFSPQDLAVPNNISGSGFLYIKTDATDLLLEAIEANNVSDGIPVDVEQPDVNLEPDPSEFSIYNASQGGGLGEGPVVLSVSQTPLQFYTSSTISFNWFVSNTGSHATTARTWRDRVLFSRDANVSGDDIVLADRSSGYSFETPLQGNYPEGSDSYYSVFGDGSYEYTIPDDLLGSGYLLLQVDAFDDQYEIDETDNIVFQAVEFLAPPQVNLTATGLEVRLPSNPDEVYTGPVSWGQTINLSWSVAITGDVPTSSFYYDKIVFSSDQIFGNQDDIWLIDNLDYAYHDPNSSYTVSTQITLPNYGQFASTGYLLFKTDAYNYQAETDENDNVYAQPIEIAEPNLIITNVTAPTTAIAGQTVALSWTGKNDGSVTTGSSYWYDRVVFSKNQIFGDSDDVYLNETYIYSAYGLPLEPQETYTAIIDVTLPTQAIGAGYILFKADAYSYQGESNESDNVYTQSIDIAAPNLIITNVTAPTTAIAGQTVALSWTGKNDGSVTTGSSYWYDRVVFSKNQIFGDSDDVYLNETYIYSAYGLPLEPQETYTAIIDVTLPTQAIGAGYILFKADAYSYQGESNESDNVYTQSIDIAAPNLIITNVTAPTTAIAGQTVALSWTGKNDGSVTTGSSYWYDRVVFSKNQIFGDSDDVYLNETYIYSVYGLPLEPQETYTASIDVTLPTQAIGAGYILFKADAYSYQGESNESDNVYTQSIDIAAPNLIITNVTAPTTAIAGQTVTLSWTGKNDGSVTTGSSYWYDRVVFSKNQIFGDSDDVYLNETYIYSAYGLPLEPQETYTASLNVTLPGQAFGDGYLLFKTDNYNYQGETNDNDNVYSQAIAIEAPNLTITKASAPIAGILGGSIAVSWTVLNNGTVSANADWYDSVYLSNDQTWDSGDTWIGAFWEAVNSPLAANTSYTDIRNITIPSGAGIGAKYLIFVTDQYFYSYYNQQAETNEADNAYVVPITLGAPDLIISGATAPNSGVVNGAINVSWTVKNQGTTDAPADWYDVIYLSSDSIFGNGNDSYISDQYINTQTPLTANGSYTINRNINLPNITPGSYYIFFHADAYNYQGETNDNNNYSQAIAITIGAPDLIVSNATAPESGALGEAVSLSWTVQNQGTIEAPADWSDYIYWSSNDTFDGSDILITSFSAAAQTPIAAGGSYSRSQSITLPNQVTFVGNGYLIVRADGNNVQGETNEANNDRAIPIRIDAPDLIVSNATAPASVTVGATIGVTWDVKNQGLVAANADWYDRIVISTDQVFGNSDDTYLTEVWQGSFTPLAAAATYSRTLNVTLPNTATGDRYLLFKADNYNYQGETDETNNVYSLPINISASDLQITATNAPSTAILGETVELTWTVTNNGTGAASQDWYDRVYLSSNQVLDGGDVQITLELIGTQTPLGAGASYTISKNVTLSSFTPGNQYLLFIADRDNYQGETNDNNNLAAVPISLTAPDLIVSNASVPATGTVGKSIGVSWTVQNQGTSAAPTDWYDRIYLSNDAVFDANADTYITQELISTQTPLAAGASYSTTRNINLPNFAIGNRYLIFVADSSGGQGETNETNNTRAVAINLNAPDLVVSEITAPVESLSGQPIEINWTVKNQGAVTAEGTWYDYVALLNTATNSTQYVGVFEYSGSLAAGASLNRTQSYSVPLSLTGNYRVVVTSDYYGQIAEGTQNESNNTTTDDRSISLQLAPVPNLQVTGVTAPSTAFSSQETVVQWTVKNVGTGATNAPIWYDRVYLSLDTTYDNTDTYLGQAVNPSYLNPNESYANSLTVSLPRGIDNNYYFLVQTDGYNYVTEVGNEEDNWKSGGPTDVNLTPPPDLKVAAVNAPNAAFSGQPMNLSWTVTNAGTGRTLETAWYDRVFMSADATLDPDDRILGTFYHDGALNPGVSYAVSTTVNLPIGVAGNFFLFVQSDIYNQVYEHVFENNNSGYDTTATNITLTPPPDLEFEYLTIPNNARSGNNLSISYRVTNFGATETPTSYWTDTFYLSSDNQLNTTTDIILGSSGQYGILYPGDGYDRTANFTLPNTLTGTYYVFGVTDSGDQVFELNNVNNVTQSINQVQIVAQPADLVVTDAVIPTTGEAGKAISVQWTVKNQGTGDTIVNTWSDRLVASTDGVLGDADDLTLASFTRTGLLAPNGTYSRTESVILPFTLEGNYQLFVVTDSANSVYEGSNEGNNGSSAFPLTISRDTPDLQVTSITLPNTVTPGQALILNWTVANLGVGRTNSNYWYDQVYLSLDKNVSNDDINLGSVYRAGALEPSAIYSASGAFTLPVNLSGSYYVLVQADRDNNVIEGAFENNNIFASDSSSGGGSGTGSLPITPAPSADLAVSAVDAPEQGIAGQSLSLSWTVDNNDSNTSQSWYDAVYLSRDQVFDRNSDIYLGYRTHAGGLNAGESYTATHSFNIPRGLGGRFYAFVVTDSGNSIYERLGEINNVNYDGFSTEIILPPPVDLTVGTITIPVNGAPGKTASITYTVENQSTNDAIGTWEDAIYLSRDNRWDANDALFARVSQSGPVNGGSEYTKTVSSTLPGLATGDYYVIVRSDIRNYIPESNETNNLKASLDDFTLDVELLSVGTPDTGMLSQGQPVYYKIDVLGGETLRLRLDSSALTADNQIFISYNAMPTRSQFDFTNAEPFVADSEVIIPTTADGSYYILVNPVSGPFLQDYTIQAEIIPFGVQNIDISQGGQDGNVTIKLNGAKFLPTSKVFLEDTVRKYEAQNVYFQDGVTLYATFNLKNVPLGFYDVLVEADDVVYDVSATDYVPIANAPDDILFPVDPTFTSTPIHLSSRLDNAFEVTLAKNASLSLQSFMPVALRPNQAFTYTYSYRNDSNNDIASPLLFLSSDPGIRSSLAGEAKATPGEKLVLALADSGPATIIRPGQGGSVTLTGSAPNIPTTLSLGADFVGNTSYNFDLANLLRSAGVDPNSSTWSQSVASFSDSMDGTWSTYEDVLRQEAFQQWQDGVRQYNSNQLLLGELADLGTSQSSATSFASDIALAPMAFGICLDPIARDFRTTLNSIAAVWGLSGKPDASAYLFRYLNGPGGNQVFGPNDSISQQAATDQDVISLNSQVTSQIQQWLDAQIKANNRPVSSDLANTPAAGSISSKSGNLRLDQTSNLYYAINGTQGLTGAISNLTYSETSDPCDPNTKIVSYNGKLAYTFMDWYNFTESDARKDGLVGLFGKMAYYLEHITPDSDCRSYPYQNFFTVEFPIQGTVRVESGTSHSDCPPPPVPDPVRIPVVRPIDPNDIIGPPGFGDQSWIASQTLPYTIRFENQASATAPAQTVTITHPLDSDLDLRTFRLGSFGWSGLTFNVPENRSFYNQRVDLTEDYGFLVDVFAGVDTDKAQAFWTLTTIDPETGEIPENPLNGFLPPNNYSGVGDGFVNYTIRPRRTAVTGTVIDAQATIIFDTEEPISTPPIYNTLDVDRPIGAINDLPATTVIPEFLVSWDGTDIGAAIASHTIYVSDNGSSYVPWLIDTSLLNATYTGTPGHAYRFYALAKDNAGNVQEVPLEPQASIFVQGVVNQPPSAVELSNVTAALAENSSTTSQIKLADIAISDDALGTNSIVLSGADAAAFEVEGTVLYLKAGTNLDYETKAAYAVTVSVSDASLSGSSPVSTGYSLSITDVNEAPTAVALSNVTAALGENRSTASRIKVADIAISDDALGTNSIVLSGADAAAFEVEGTALYLKAGTNLDYETKAAYAVTVSVSDASLSGSSPVSTGYSLSITDVNEAPTAVALSNVTAALAENSSTASRIKVADIAISDDALGSNTISLLGADAAAFEVEGTALHLKAGTNLDYETKAAYAVTVSVSDASLSGSSPVSTGYSLSITDVNEAPTAVALSNVTAALGENRSTASRIKVADIAISDDALGTNSIVLSGADAAAFEVEGTALYLKAGTNLDYETKAAYAVTVSVSDASLSGSSPVSTGYSLSITDVNEAPTAVALTSVTTSLAENSSTASRIKLADIAISDDALGTNSIVLSGADAAAFEVEGTALYLKAGTNLDYETKAAYAVTVSVSDASLSGSSPVSTSYSLSITDVNEAPTAVALSNVTAALAENSSTASRIKVADIAISDDALGSNTISLLGADAAAFEVEGTALYLKAGTNLDYETKAAYAVTVSVSDASLSGSSPVSTGYSLSITDVNEAPTAVALSNVTAALAENSSTASRIKVADIAISDDALGTNSIVLSGADAAAFEVEGTVLYLKAGTNLDYETKASYAVTLSVLDSTISGSSPVSTGYSLSITDVNEAPTAVALGNVTAALAENISTASRIKLADIAISDDALGSNTISLLGADAAAFEVEGTALYLKAGTNLDYETKAAYAVTVSVSDASLSGSSPVSTGYSLSITDVNEAPTAVALSNVTAALAENSSTASRIKVADIAISDDALGTNTISLLGADAAAFEVEGTVLYLKAGTNLDYETKAAYAVTVSVSDASLSGSSPVSTVYNLPVTDVNEAENQPPSAVDLTNVISSLAENSSTTSQIKLADIAISDDALGTNSIVLSGADAAAFEVEGTVLYLKAGTNLDYETKASYAVTLSVLDSTISGSSPVSTGYSLSITDVNEAPTAVALGNVTAALAENISTASRIKLADIAISDDALGSNTISLLGADAAAFEVEGTALYLKAGTNLDYETKAAYSVTVSVSDASLSGSSPVSTSYSLSITDVNEAPTAVALSNVTAALAENTSTSSRIKVADIAISDDALGTNTISLLGADAAAFEVEGTALYLKAGTNLDYETKASYAVTLSVFDSTISGSSPVSTAYSLAITDGNEAPTALVLSATALNENIAAGSLVASLSSSDPDTSPQSFSYALVAGAGDADNLSFFVSGSELHITSSPDYEVKSSYGIRLRATDQGGLSFERHVTLAVNDLPDSPSYSFSSSAPIVYEGGALALGISSSNVAPGSRIYWSFSGAGISSADFTDGIVSGTSTLGADGGAGFTKTITADGEVEGDEGLEVKFFSDSARTQQLGTTLMVTIKEPLVGGVTDGPDIITGTAADETIRGVPTGSTLRGKGTVDKLTGGGGKDTFVLGDASGVFYDDGIPTAPETRDMAWITDFSAGDKIILFGGAANYQLISARYNGLRGVQINAVLPASVPEPIGFIQAATLTTLSLANSSQFTYLNTP